MTQPCSAIALAPLLALCAAGCGAGAERLALLEQRVARLEAMSAPKQGAPAAVAAPQATTMRPTEEGWGLSGFARDL